jgi:ABC-type Fe3+/spermidine/putrescine transport system ATPase subunit
MIGSGLRLRGLHVLAGGFHLEGVDLSITPGRVLVVLGPSGAGKTVMLDTVAGFRRPAKGTVELDGRDITRLPPEVRAMGMVFQNYALFPHLSVVENVRFGPRALGRDDPAAARELLERVGIAHLADRRAATLSGGERQRVAIARALAIAPRALLLDEPLSALDAPTRDELRSGLRDLLDDVSIPSVYVTHDQAEATIIGDDLAVLMHGRLRQSGPVADVFDRPADLEVARFLGLRALGTVRREGGGAVVGPRTRVLHVSDRADSDDAVACYRPSDVEILPQAAATGENTFQELIAAVHVQTDVVRIEIGGPLPLEAVTLPRIAREMGLAAGRRVGVRIAASSLRLVPSR